MKSREALQLIRVLHHTQEITHNSLPLLASVALTVDVPEHSLTRGQMGTVVEHLESAGEFAALIEFADLDGEAYAILPLKPDQLLLLHRGDRAA